jgi:hypothetical protein
MENIEVEKFEGGCTEAADVIECIYNTPLEQKVKFVRIGYCGCNMGNCSAVVNVRIDGNEYNTYGDVMSLFGPEYPDSIWLNWKG